MATGRVTRKVLDYIAEINRTAKQMKYVKELKKKQKQANMVHKSTLLSKEKTKVKYYDRDGDSSTYDY